LALRRVWRMVERSTSRQSMLLTRRMQSFTLVRKTIWTGWPNWANVCPMGDDLLCAVSWKLQK
jgi:hypothetical protein